jgi:molybdopterin-guanine dinucleotide biosynthesis protein A
MTLQPVTILLAGGRSARFGRDKPTIIIGGETLIERHIRQAQAADVSKIIVIANRGNISEITHITERMKTCPVEVCLQEGANAEGAILTGLCRVADSTAVYISCTNDVVPDDTYIRLRRKAEEGTSLTITTATLKWRFTGGTLALQETP